ncbi:MAG TPA: hypothetical protein PLN61_16510, partial [bacterium]|nr:hypothetical protein [bacterium]
MRYPAFDFAAVVLWIATGLGAAGGSAWAQPAVLQPLSKVLRADGTIDLSSTPSGVLDPSGFTMSVDSQGRPRFTPARTVQPSTPEAIEKWSSEYAFSGADNIVTALAVRDGVLYVGGYFSAIGPIMANRIAKWDGASWSALGSGVDGNVHAILVTETGVFIGGDFIYAGNIFCQRIAQWDGARWNPLGEGFNGKVRALSYFNGALYAGGEFTASGPIALNRIAQWNGSSWSAVGAGCNGPVLAFAASSTDLYVGGDFTFIGSTPVNRVGRWTGAAWFTLAAGTDATVRALAWHNGALYAGGDFTTAGTVSANYIARWNGAAWIALGSGADQRVTALATDGLSLYAGGHFYTIGGIAALRLAKWDGSTWRALGNGVNSFVYALACSGSRLHVGGDFSTAGMVTANHIATWDGEFFRSLYSGKGFNGPVYAILRDGAMTYIAGSFTQGGGISASSIICYNGTTWSPLGKGINGTVYALAKQGSDLFAGGRFNSASGIAASNIARWSGTAWSAVGTGLSNGSPGTGTVYALASNGIDSLVAGGEFNTAGGVPAYRVALWNGGSWKPIGLGMDNTVYALTYESFMFYAGGKFRNTQGGGYYLNYAAMWSGDRQAWFPMVTGLDSTVYVMRPGLAGVVYVGGNFTKAGTLPARRLARWAGSIWDPVSSGANGPVRAIDVIGDNIYIGGDFMEAGGLPARRFAIFHAGTNSWSAPGNGLDSTVYALGGGDLFLGGAFTKAGSKPSFRFAQWLENSYVYLQAKIFLQGPYDPVSGLMSTALNTANQIPLVSPYPDHRMLTSIPANITDWVQVELRDAGFGFVTAKSVLLNKNGALVDDDGINTQIIMEGVPDGNYHIVIRHRNHIAVMSATPIALSSGPAAMYDFTTAESQSWTLGPGGRACVELKPNI